MLAVVAMIATAAHAEDSVFAGTVPDDPEEKPVTHLSAEIGGTYTTGNSYIYALNALARADHTWKRNKLSGNVGANIGGSKSDLDDNGALSPEERALPAEEDVRRIYGEARYDRFLSDMNAIYVLAGAFHDPFSGFDLRSHEQVGYSRFFVKEEKTEIRGELGFDVAQEDYVDGVDPNYENIIAGRALAGIAHAFNESVGFSETFEIYVGILDTEDVRILNTATFTSRINSYLALKLSNALIFDNVPVEGFGNFDQTTMVTLVATIL